MRLLRVVLFVVGNNRKGSVFLREHFHLPVQRGRLTVQGANNRVGRVCPSHYHLVTGVYLRGRRSDFRIENRLAAAKRLGVRIDRRIELVGWIGDHRYHYP